MVVPELGSAQIAVIGLGYVGLPLAVAFAKKYDVLGFDIDMERVAELNNGYDRTLEVSTEELATVGRLEITADPETLKRANTFIITTPTPIDGHNNPDLRALLSASRTVGVALAVGDVVVYESTVYPGATEEDCVPVLESVSGLRFGTDFSVGYSPERINPGDKIHRFETICKVTSGSSPEAAEYVDSIYSSVVSAGTYKASSIKVAEAAKVIENTQRDVNIALINELAMLFRRLGIDTQEVLHAAGTKWNFLPFRPGLVGGHCIGVDPYYLTHKAQAVGYHPEVILAGRRLNDSMGAYVASQLVMTMLRRKIDVRDARVLVLGLTFKENTPDLRNTRVVDVCDELRSAGLLVDVHDPWVSVPEAEREYGIEIVEHPAEGEYDAILLAVAHEQFIAAGANRLHAYGKQDAHVFFDLKSVLPRTDSDLRL